VEAWQPGERGGDAIADILFGDYNPSGRLPVTIPRHVGQLPSYYNYNPSKGLRMGSHTYVDMSGEPLYHFGHGLSYTSFEYSDLKTTRFANGAAHVQLTVKNTGHRQGEETVQFYLHELVASIARPVMELKGFRKIRLDPGQAQVVDFSVNSNSLSFINSELQRVVEPGTFQIMVGSSSHDIRLKGSLDIN
jgi:beta-glucosidase